MSRLTTHAALTTLFFGLVGCGAGPIIQKGDVLLKQGRHSAAIVRYEEALRVAEGNPQETKMAAAALQRGRRMAAAHYVSKGDKLRDQRHLREAGQAYKQAASFLPTNRQVVSRQADLLKRRLRIEQDIEETRKSLAALQPRGRALKDLDRWLSLARLAEGLVAWQHDYPAVRALFDAVAEPTADVLIKDAERAIGVEEFQRAQLQVQRALRLRPKHPRAGQLLDLAAERGKADTLAKQGNHLLEKGDSAAAVQAYEGALKKDPASLTAKQGVREAKRRYVEARIKAIKQHQKKRRYKAALIAVLEAKTMGTDYPKLQKAINKWHAALTTRAAKRFHKLGRRHENRREWGAALLSYRTASAIGGAPKDTAKRVAKMQRKVAELRQLKLYMPMPKVPRDSFATSANTLMRVFREAVTKSDLPARGVTLIEDRRAARNADGKLRMNIERFTIRRAQRLDERRKKYLDRVEFPPNPQWGVAQSHLSASLAAMNAATDDLRPVQEELNAAEERLAKLDSEYVKLKARIRKEDGLYYQNKKPPCPDGSTSCAQSYANRRWAKHRRYYNDQITKTNGKIATLSPRYQKLRDQVQQLNTAFQNAERVAHETPPKLREEIWLDYNYNVTIHEVRYEATVALDWLPKKGKKPLATSKAQLNDHKIDFSTPGIIVKKQTLEPPKQSQLTDDVSICNEVSNQVVTELARQLWPVLQIQGMRFARAADTAKKRGKRIHMQVLALATANGIDSATRRRLTGELLAQTGWNWDEMKLDFARLPYK